MAVSASQVAVGTSAVQLSANVDSGDGLSGQSVAVLTCDVDLFLGPTSSVTTGNGAKLTAGSPIGVDLDGGDHLWAIAAGSGTAHVLRTGV